MLPGGTRVPRKGEEMAYESTTSHAFVPLSHAAISSSLFQMTPSMCCRPLNVAIAQTQLVVA
jgi:hypothetical protein